MKNKKSENGKPLSHYYKKMGFEPVNSITKKLKAYHNEKYSKPMIVEQRDILQTRNPIDVQNAMSAKKDVSTDKTTLTFDSKTGELIVSSGRIDNDHNVVVDQIYKDGFFFSKAA